MADRAVAHLYCCSKHLYCSVFVLLHVRSICIINAVYFVLLLEAFVLLLEAFVLQCICIAVQNRRKMIIVSCKKLQQFIPGKLITVPYIAETQSTALRLQKLYSGGQNLSPV